MKYYTPNIDEIHYGISYEFNQNGIWFPEYLTSDLDPNSIRIKYLDVDDIINQDFQLYGETPNSKMLTKRVESHKSNHFIEVVLTYIGDDPMISISVNNEPRLVNCFCKNVYEFKTLINRLNL